MLSGGWSRMAAWTTRKEASFYVSYSLLVLRTVIDIGSLLGTLLGTMLTYKKNTYMHSQRSLDKANTDSKP